jgi:hypothetical protein
MMLTLNAVGRCRGCSQEINGCQFLFVKRINLGSIVSEQSLWMLDRHCGCDPNDNRHEVEVLSSRLTEESEALVEKAREKIRARRKQAA